MARPLRIEFPGAWYHVMNRGAGRRAVFNSDTQRAYFLSLLREASERFNAEWHAYCLMRNHYHLLVRTPQGNLQRIMRHVNGLYTQYFNRNEGRDGPLFRGRYKAILVDAEAHWLALSRYIHRNPLEAGLIRELPRYRWSSYRAYAGHEPPPPWLSTRYILKAIASRSRQRRYRAYVTGASDDTLAAFYRQARIPPILGEAGFRKRVLAGFVPDIDRPELRAVRRPPGLDPIVAATARCFGVKRAELFRSRRGRAGRTPARAVAMYLCQNAGDMRLADIARAFGLASYASAGAVVRGVKARLAAEKDLAKKVNNIILDLTP